MFGYFSKNYYFCRVLEIKYEIMIFMTFRERMYPIGCFNINQVLLWEKDVDRDYGTIPKEVVQLACVTTIKTAKVENVFDAEQN